ncbi:MAG: hypothetical protein LCI03_06845 [Actinobacteria bacterium]|jgi:hypothetical protein|nr:hypothetical protein [Actinomycetota bacterium]
MTAVPPATPLRRAVLAVVLSSDDALGDVELTDDGIHHEPEGFPPLLVSWNELQLAADGAADSALLARRVARWMRLRVHVHALVHSDGDARDGSIKVVSQIRMRALPHDHAVHPGTVWTIRSVLGGALDVGLALRGVDDDGLPDPEGVGVVPVTLLRVAGIDVAAATERADRHLADMARLAAERVRRDTNGVLRPLGDADVLTLLAHRNLREVLVEGMGMRSAAVPVRNRGWLDLGRIDPAFAVSAAELTEPDDRGFSRPVLITRDEVALIKLAGDPIRQSLADPAPDEHPAPPRRRPA